MDEEKFKSFCSEKKLSGTATLRNIEIARKFEAFLRKRHGLLDLGKAKTNDLQTFAQQLMNDGENTWDNFLCLLRYFRFVQNKDMEIAMLELLDGSDVLKGFCDTISQSFGEETQRKVFNGFELPPLGTSSKDKPKITKEFMRRLEVNLSRDKCLEILMSCPHAGPREAYLSEKDSFLKSKGIDDFLEKRHKAYVSELEKLMEMNTLYFTQEITEEVLDYVRNTPTCQNGVREGNTIIITKIPYMAKKYLQEKDLTKKRHYYCHCPWVREAILSGLQISPDFCYCSAGYEKRMWDVIFDQPVKADVLKSVLKGDPICKFAVHIPPEFVRSI
jgi:hypothetical protein